MSNDKLHDPFNPDGGEFAKNIRSITDLDDAELRESLKRLGWLKELPALADENDVILAGHRRIRLAKQLGIDPVIKKLRIGSGDKADARRLALAIASNLGHAPMTRDDRKRIAEYLYGEREWTMAKIAEALNVNQATVSRDLGNLCDVHKSKPAKTASNPKGAGRPKGSGSKRKGKKNDSVAAEAAAKLVLDAGMTHEQAGAETGAGSELLVRVAVAREEGRREAQITPEMLSMSAQEKLDAAIRQHKRKLDAEFEQRVLRECRTRIEATILPSYNKSHAEHLDVIRSRKGIMDRFAYRKILSCLHPDRVSDETQKKRYEEAFRIFTELEKRLLDETQSPTEMMRMPRSYDELMAMKQKVSEARKTKRAVARAARATA